MALRDNSKLVAELQKMKKEELINLIVTNKLSDKFKDNVILSNRFSVASSATVYDDLIDSLKQQIRTMNELLAEKSINNRLLLEKVDDLSRQLSTQPHNSAPNVTICGDSVHAPLDIESEVMAKEHSPLNKSLQKVNLEGMDYGSGMAHSFFHGYLRIVLPTKGTGEKGLIEVLTDYEDKNNIKFDVKKLFILIPKSLHCPPRLDSYFSKSIERSTELESKKIDRAGVSNREYKNSVYKINIAGHKKYVVAEYATPVKTLNEVIAENTPFAKIYYPYRREITLNFYLTLKELIKNDPECCNICEIIYYDDLHEDGFNYIDVGEIISKRMNQIVA